tara:strand:+ start:173 stop:475 length:303 start_codon:yes stop_codon:yes gene_type:complete
VITYKITKQVPYIYELEIDSNITLPYGVIMELQNEVSAGVIAFMHQDLTQETLTILKHYENEMGDLDTTNLNVTGSLVRKYENDTIDENHNDVEIEGEFL